jgi:transcriptional regulator with XRE-family HTH domain
MKRQSHRFFYWITLIVATHRLQNYLRTHRKRAALSQREVAYLLGTRSGTKISRHESFVRQPPLRTVLAYEVIYGVHARELFAGIYDHVRHETLKRVESLHRHLQAQPADRLTSHKIKSLEAVLSKSKAGSRKSS